ncbi:MAG: 4Fe-4S dicluster domain-containing protein [Bacteroidales bacterium]|jgi:heterodisulfide reductase subunit C|nr:4Fe-4S dicluster domain-containing protein [Bacteroidales bacterium]
MGLIELLKKDVRFQEGLTACINCGTCTAICPAARFYPYDPRIVVDTVQRGNEADILTLLESDIIWYCGECLSCKTRCPRNNTPGYIIQALRDLSQELGCFIKSKRGRQQLEVKRIIGENMIRYGYCVYLDEIDLVGHPEQGPVWQWYRDNADSILKRLGANYKGDGSGTLRKISDEDMLELNRIFEVTGAIKRFEKIEKLCEAKVEKA